MLDQYITLDNIGFDRKYIITLDGKIFNTLTNKELIGYRNTYRLKDNTGKYRTVSLKSLYRKVFNKEYCIDNIQNLDNELWKPIENTKGKYYISNMGRIKSLCGYKAKLLTPYNTGKGYLKVRINNKNKSVHILVAQAFIYNDNPQKKITVDHIDGNKKFNVFYNLQWLSLEDNIRKYHRKYND